jgi:3-oxoacyl-[acyl-carrier-protein] synthase II
MRRVVVTGIGVVSPIGVGREALWESLRSGASGVRAITRFDASDFNCRISAEVSGFQPENWIDRRRLKRLDRYSSLALVAGILAMRDACLEPEEFDSSRAGVTVGSALGGIGCAEEEKQRFDVGGLRAVSPSLALSVFGGAATCNLAIHFGLEGFNSANADSCASSPIALGAALHAIRRGECDVMLAGGAEAPLFPLTFGAFSLIRAMSTRNDSPETACRPFDEARDGFVMGEGAALLVLEEEGHAVRRGARIYAELAGFSATNDAHHMTAPRDDARSASRAMVQAVSDAGVSVTDVDYVNAHASSTPLNDSAETLAMKRVLGERAGRVPISGTKPFHGHSLGAAGAIEAAICCLAIARGWIPPTLNLDRPGDGLDLDYVPNQGRELSPGCVLSNSFGFGGINASVVLLHPEFRSKQLL